MHNLFIKKFINITIKNKKKKKFKIDIHNILKLI